MIPFRLTTANGLVFEPPYMVWYYIGNTVQQTLPSMTCSHRLKFSKHFICTSPTHAQVQFHGPHTAVDLKLPAELSKCPKFVKHKYDII